MSSSPFVSVIVPTYYDWERLSLCLKALAEQSYPRFEVIVVNNAPEDPPPEWLPVPENVIFVDEPKRGAYAARNAGVERAKGEIVGFTDSDCIPERSWIEAAVTRFEKEPKIFRLGGKIQVFFKNQTPNLVEKYNSMFGFHQKDYVKRGVAATANMFTRREVFESVGLFNEELMSGGDMEWGQRAQDHGFSVVFEEHCVVKHPARYEMSELLKKARRVAGGSLKVEKVKSSYLGMLYDFRPSPKLYWYCLKESDSFFQAHALYFMKYYIKLVKNWEKLKLKQGAQAERE